MEEVKFTLEQILRYKRFRHRVDALKSALEDGEYTLAEAEAALDEFLGRSVE